MYAALGLLTAALVALMLIPPFWRRAVRLNRREIEATLPMTRAEINADKDQLRAGFAVSTRKLETTVERLEAKVAEREVELGQKREIIAHLTAQGSLSAQGIGVLEKGREELLATLHRRDAQIAETDEARKLAERRVGEIEARLDAARQQLEAMVGEREAERLELVARDTELGNLRDRIAAAKTADNAESRADALAELRTQLASAEVRREAALEERHASEAARRALDVELRAGAIALAAAREELVEARSRIDTLSARLADAEAARASLEAANARLSAPREPPPATGESAALRLKLVEIGEAVAKLAAPAALPPPATDETVADGASIVPLSAPLPAIVATAEQPPAPRPKGLAERIRALQQTSKAG